jgi:hypothetical protein
MKHYRAARIAHSSLFGVLSYLLVNSSLATPCGSAAEETQKKTIVRLIEDLSSDRFEVRDAATCVLKDQIETIPALREARKSIDLEVRRRVEDILQALERKRAFRRLGKAKALGQAGRVVEVADRLALAAKYNVAGEEGWESLTQFADQVITCMEPYFRPGSPLRRNPDFPAGEFRQFVKRVKSKEIAEPKIEIDTDSETPGNFKGIAGGSFIKETGGKLLLRGEEVSLMGRSPGLGLCTGMIAASGDVQIIDAMDSVIIAGGNIKSASFLSNCILICDGDVEFLSPPILKNLIVARGKVTCKQGQLRNCVIQSGRTLRLLDGKTIDLKDGTPDPLAFVKFFELADVGLIAADAPAGEKPDAEGVRLQDVSKKSPFATGLRRDDVVTAIEEKKTPTKETFRRVLRRKRAEGGPIITFTVRRAGKTLEVPIAVKD